MDFYGVGIEAEIIIPDGEDAGIYPLWVYSQANSKLPNGLKDLSYLQNMTVQLGMAMNSRVTITLTPPVEEGMEIANSPLLRWASSRLRVSFGYKNNTWSKKYEGLITKPDVRMVPDCTITLHAIGVGWPLYLANSIKTQSFPPGTTPWEACKQMLQEMNYFNLEDEHVIFPDMPSYKRDKWNPDAYDFFKPITHTVNGKKESVAIEKGPRSNWEFIKEYTLNFGMDFVIKDQTIRIYRRTAWRASKPVATFAFRGRIDTENRVFPIIDFVSPSAYVWLGKGIAAIAQADIGSDTKKKLEQTLTTISKPDNKNPYAQDEGSILDAPAVKPLADIANTGIEAVKLGVRAVSKLAGFQLPDSWKNVKTVEVTRVGGGTTYNPASTGADAGQLFPGSPETEAATQAEAELENFNSTRGIQCDVTSIGIPDLEPACVVDVTGLGTKNVKTPIFDGLYGVLMVEHNVGVGGATTKFRGLRNFIPDTGLLSAGEVNENAAPETKHYNRVQEMQDPDEQDADLGLPNRGRI